MRAPFLVPIYDALALPLGELSPQVTERTLRPRDVICLRRCQHFPIGRCRYLPSPSSLRSATSPTGEAKCRDGNRFTTIRLSGGTRIEGSRKTVNGAYRYRYAPFLVPIYDALALPLGELSPQVTERSLAPAGRHLPAKVPAFSDWTLPLFALSVLAALGHLSHRERQRECRDGNRFTTIRLSGGTRIEGSRKTVNGAYRYRCAPFLVPIYDALALPLGELSPQVTERNLAPAGRHLPAKVPAFSDWTLPLFALSVLAALGHLSHRERQGSAGTETVYDHPTFGRHAH